MVWTGEIEKCRLSFLATQLSLVERTFIAEQFGDNPVLADTFGNLIRDGIKTATCSALWELQARNDPWPDVGLLTIVLNGNHEPLCVIETTEVNITPYNEVDERFARDEGEGNRSLQHWRRIHWVYFMRVLTPIGKSLRPKGPWYVNASRLSNMEWTRRFQQ